MTKTTSKMFSAGPARFFSLVAAVATLLISTAAHAAIDGVEGTSFGLTASEGYISIADGGSIYSWGYSEGGAAMQLPGPTLIVNEGETVTIELTNALPAAAGNVSIVFPGHQLTSTSNGVAGPLTRERAAWKRSHLTGLCSAVPTMRWTTKACGMNLKNLSTMRLWMTMVAVSV